MFRENLFIHIPKTGGTTVHFYLDEYATQKPDHILGIEAKKKWPECFRYTIMRNPYTRMVSCYESQFPRRLNHYHLPKEPVSLTFERYVYIITNNSEYGKVWDLHWIPQTDFILDDDDRLIVDYIGHPETLEKDINEIGRLIGAGVMVTPSVKKGFEPKPSYMELDKFDVVVKNKSDWRYPQNYRQYFNDDTRKKVEKYYEKDIEFLKVKF